MSAAVDFPAAVLAASEHQPVLVDFWAPWCGPCKMLGPVLERLAAAAAGRWTLVKIDTDAQPELAEQFQIRGIPNVKLFHRGRVIAEFAGAMPEPQLKQWLEQHLPAPAPRRAALVRARSLLAAGQAAAAAEALAPLAEAPAASPELLALAARATVFTDEAAARALLDRLPAGPAPSDDARIAAALADAFATLADPADRPIPDRLRAPYLEALRHLRAQDFHAAASGLIAVLQEQPDCDRQRARTACLALFQHLGFHHPITDEFHRAYGMAVNI